jgi:hypothetical protein
MGRPLAHKFEDSQAKSAIATQAARKLVYQDRVDALMGIDSSGVAQGLVPSIAQLRERVLTALATRCPKMPGLARAIGSIRPWAISPCVPAIIRRWSATCGQAGCHEQRIQHSQPHRRACL